MPACEPVQCTRISRKCKPLAPQSELTSHQGAAQLLRQLWDHGLGQPLADEQVGAEGGEACAQVSHGLHQELGSEAWGVILAACGAEKALIIRVSFCGWIPH